MLDQVQRIAELTAALEEAQQRIRQLETLAHEDELTQILNRRGFFRELLRARAWLRRHGGLACLVLIDMDGLKALNDRHGHAVGDAALRHLARTLASSVRASDAVARLGGDEFAMLLFETGTTGANRVLDTVMSRLQTEPLPLPNGSVSTLQISAGAAALDPDMEVEVSLAQADYSLYAAKMLRKAEVSEALRR